MATYLSVVERAYHGTLEEQDDTVLWVNHMFKKAGAEVSVLLRANSVNYAVKGQDASGLTFGQTAFRVPPTLDRDVEDLVKAGVPVYVVSEDLADRGIATDELVGGIKSVSRGEVAKLFDQYDQVWHW